MITPKTVLTCNEECVTNFECDHFNFNAGSNECELQKKGYCT